MQTSPDSSPPDSPRTPPPPKRGSTTSPGQETLAAAGRWLTVLVCSHHTSGLLGDALSLLNDLMQLLYYHGSSVAQSDRHSSADDNVHLLSPVVQVGSLPLLHRHNTAVAPLLLLHKNGATVSQESMLHLTACRQEKLLALFGGWLARTLCLNPAGCLQSLRTLHSCWPLRIIKCGVCYACAWGCTLQKRLRCKPGST